MATATNEKEPQLTKQCSTCGATIVISPEDFVITCKFCGETTDVEGAKIPDHQMLPSLDSATIKANIDEFLRKNKIKAGASTEEIKVSYIPYWVVPFSSQTHYFGVQNSTVTRQKTETYKDSEGKTRTRTVNYSVPVYKPEEGDFSRSGRENVIARKHTAFYGFDKFQDTLFLENIKPFDYNSVKNLGADFINAEVNAHESQRETYGRVENENRSIAAGKVNKLVRCDSQISTQYPIYVHTPLWQARYKFQGKVYKVSAAGDSGKVVKGEIPLTLGRRITNLVLGLLLIAGGGIMAQLGYTMAQTNETMYVLMIIGIVLFVIGLFPSSTAFKMQLEKSDKIKRPPKQKGKQAPAKAAQ